MVLKEIYTEIFFEVIDSENNISKLKRRYIEDTNKIEWFFADNSVWINLDKVQMYYDYPMYSHFKNGFYEFENLEMLYRNKKINKILK